MIMQILSEYIFIYLITAYKMMTLKSKTCKFCFLEFKPAKFK